MPYDISIVIVFGCSFYFSNLHILWHADADGALNSKPELLLSPVVHGFLILVGAMRWAGL